VLPRNSGSSQSGIRVWLVVAQDTQSVIAKISASALIGDLLDCVKSLFRIAFYSADNPVGEPVDCGLRCLLPFAKGCVHAELLYPDAQPAQAGQE